MTIPHDTTAKLIGLAATGAAMLGLSLEEALLTPPAELTAYIRTLTGAGLLPGTTAPAAAVAVKEEPASHPHLYPRPPRYPRPADGRLCGTSPEPEPPPVPPCDPDRFFNL